MKRKELLTRKIIILIFQYEFRSMLETTFSNKSYDKINFTESYVSFYFTLFTKKSFNDQFFEQEIVIIGLLCIQTNSPASFKDIETI